MGIFDIFNSEKKSEKRTNIKYQKNDVVYVIKDKKIAIFGFGDQAEAHALNLKDSGIKNIVIALRENSKSISKAEAKGFKVMKLSKAAAWADIIIMLIPFKAHYDVYAKYIEQ